MPILRTAILCHEPAQNAQIPPAIEPHFDWLLETKPATPAECWRVKSRIDHLAIGQTVPLERINVHRSFWLELSAPQTLSGNRGVVSPCEQGLLLRLSTPPEAWSLTIQWAGGVLGSYVLHSPASPEATLCRIEEPSP